MKNIEFDAFMTSIFKLARSMVIKINAVARRDNEVLVAAGYSVSSDMTTWRYYMNMNGDYHPTDEMMTVKSVDTGEIINFTKENLAIHIGTFREYNKGEDLYLRLNSRYEGQSQLIRGILTPIPYTETIPAEDYKILKFDESLVGWNEEQLIPTLRRWLVGETKTLFVNDYMVTNDLMLPIAIMQLYADIIKKIGIIRIKAIGTRFACDFLVWSRIDSYGDFSKFKASLNQYQTMWLYRNIAWLKNNAGKQYTFGKLVDHLLTTGGVPLAKYDMVATTKDQLAEINFKPMYRKLQLNLEGEYGRAAQFIDTDTLILKQHPMATENTLQAPTYLADALAKGKHSLYSEVATKTLESSMVDYTNRHPETLMSTVYNHWVYLAGKGLYKGKILVVDPKNGRGIRLPVAEAFYVWRYLIDQTFGKHIDKIEPAYYHKVMKLVPPSLDQLVNIGGRAFIHQLDAKGIRDQWVPIQEFVAPDTLMKHAVNVYDSMWKHTKIYSKSYDLNLRARVKQTTALMYESGIVNMVPYTTYRELFDVYSLDFSTYADDEAKNFAWNIFKTITGWDSNAQPSLRAKQSDLIDIMLKLSSYTIQVVKEMDDGNDVKELRNETFMGDPKWSSEGNFSDGDYTNVRFDGKGHIDSEKWMDSVQPLLESITLKPIHHTEALIPIVNNDHFKPVNPDDFYTYPLKLKDTGYWRRLPEDDVPLEPFRLPETNYSELDFENDPNDEIPDDDYGRLVFPPLP